MSETKYYSLRVDHLGDNDIQVYDKLETYFESYLRTFELGDVTGKPHFHYYVETKSKIPTIRLYIREKMNLKGRYCLKELDSRYPIEYLAYILKHVDDDNKCKSHNIPDEILNEAISYDIDVKNSMQELKASQIPMWKQCESQVLETCSIISPRQIIPVVVDFYASREACIREFQIYSTCQTILLRNCPSYKKLFCDNLIEKFNEKK